MDRDKPADRFNAFADRECAGSSGLYEYLSLRIAEDDDLLEIASAARPGQPVPNLFFGAVHALLLKGTTHPLKHYYKSAVGNPLPPGPEAG